MRKRARARAWRAGLPCVSERPLSADERAALLAEVRKYRLLGAAAAVAGPIALTGLLVALGVSTARGFAPEWMAWGLLVEFFLTPLGVVLARDWLLRARHLQGDLGAGLVQQFMGVPDPDAFQHVSQRALLRRGILRADGEPQQFEALPVSGWVREANGRSNRRWVVAPSSEVADAPQIAAVAAEWVQPLGDPADSPHVNARELSEAELAEIGRYLRRTALKPLVPAVALTVWIGIPLVLGTLKDYPIQAGLVGLFAFGAWSGVYAAWVHCASLRRDIRDGQAVVVRVPGETEAGGPPGPLSEPEEFLPHSGVLWTVNGAPAPWRIVPN